MFELSENIGAENDQNFDPTAGVTYAWKNLNVYAKQGNIFKKKPDVHILKNGKLINKYLFINYFFEFWEEISNNKSNS